MKNRVLRNVIENIALSFPVLLLSGPRQVGKTTLLESCVSDKLKYVSLDDLTNRALAQANPALFLQRNPPPIIIDEVQYAPQLFPYIKIMVDQLKKPGLFWLTGSQKFHLMKGVQESLAGRVAILDMLGLSRSEIEDRTQTSQPFLPTTKWITHARTNALPAKPLMDIYRDIWRGSYPKVLTDNNIRIDLFYRSYVQTYIQRNVKELINITDTLAFNRFICAIAARTGQMLNLLDITRDVGIDYKTTKAWLSVLEASGLVYLLYPYHNNLTKRLIKTPKLYFLDTGLCCYLTQWTSAEALESGALSGAILETYMFTEILKTYWHNAQEARCYYYRDADQKEIDLLIEQDNTLYPVEFKKTANPSPSDYKHFGLLNKLGREIGHGAVLCLRNEDTPLNETVDAVPIGYL